jgi:ubiquinone/menaquinone biosynthesis C-methylase UbiE
VAVDIAETVAKQLAWPSGLAGRLLGSAMDIANRKPTRLAIDLLSPADGDYILDAGCGSGAGMAELMHRSYCVVTGVDRSPAMLAMARRRIGSGVALHEARIEELPFPDATFDAVLALNVLYFSDPEERMLVNLRRVLRPDGRLAAYVTHRETLENWSFARKGLHRLFDEATLADAFVAAGFAREAICVHTIAVTRSVKGLLVLARR